MPDRPPPSPEELERMNNEWIEPYDRIPEGFSYALYDTKARGEDTKGSYWYSLPEGYHSDISTTYPVLIWLHGGMQRASQGFGGVKLYQDAQKAGKMPKTIIVMPQALPVGWYINSIDNKYPIEDIIIHNFIPHVDTTFRSNGQRGIEGFSMGGYGAAHLGFTYPELFRGVSSIKPAVLSLLSAEPKSRVWDTFRDDQTYYDQNHPLTIAEEKKDILARSNIHVRLLHNGDNPPVDVNVEKIATVLKEAGVQAYWKQVVAAGIDYTLMMEDLGDETYTFWKDVFA